MIALSKNCFRNRVISLIFLAMIQLTLMPMLFPAGLMVVDLLTIAVVVNAVTLSLSQAVVIALLASLLIETHSIVPAGIYFCAYTVLVVVIHTFKGVVVWNFVGAWLVVFLLAELWLLTLLTLAIDITVIDVTVYLGKCLSALVGTTIVGCGIRSLI